MRVLDREYVEERSIYIGTVVSMGDKAISYTSTFIGNYFALQALVQ